MVYTGYGSVAGFEKGVTNVFHCNCTYIYVSDLSEPLRSFISVFFSGIKMIMRLYGKLEGESTVRFSRA